ncbi:dTDP-glucose 4,6-dehydratase [Cedecea neteri]|uniref:dTDP-glucose 4,6-dehydratase n=1 Tax=Cedecea neteri TaxID=158822 RepID=A0AAN0S7I4_9ENTR|nr:NAD(P)-dependent oxidoreductase [Cedecea neteri]AIR62968.1 dTDP-glucose 4,6-dehydratase [Cedecea neteri]
MSKYTIIGGRGFIGSHIVSLLESRGHDVTIPDRSELDSISGNLGKVIYCAGNGDCANSYFSVLEANTTLLAKVLQHYEFEKLVYISSTRVYMNNSGSSEKDDLTITTSDNRKLFNLTKLVAEELCIKSDCNVAVVRPSNVYGLALNSKLFLPSIIRNAINDGEINMFVAPDYAKDYVSVSDVAESCIWIADNTTNKEIYNVASGFNVTAQEIADVIQEETECNVNWKTGCFPREEFPVTNIEKLASLNPKFKPQHVLNDLKLMIESYKKELAS